MKKSMRDIDKLLWVVDFINQDIDSLKTGDFLKISSEFKEYFLPQYKTVSKFLLNQDLTKSEQDYFETMIKFFTALGDDDKSREIVKNHQIIIREFIEDIYPKNLNKGHIKIEFLEDTQIEISKNKIVLTKIHKKFSDLYPPIILNIAELIYNCSPHHSIEDSGLFRSLNNLKRCQAPGCTNFYWQAYKKQKNFCSNKCAMRAYVKVKREAEKQKKDEKPKRRKEV